MNTAARNLIVGYDASPDAQRALAWAVDESRRRSMRLQVLIAAGTLDELSAWGEEWSGQLAEEWKASASEGLARADGHDATIEIKRGEPADVLIEASREAAMTVLGSRGHGRLFGSLTGSVSQHVARHAHSPVVVVRAQHNNLTQRVVVGVDGSGESKTALMFAADHASRTGAALTAIHAWKISSITPGELSGARRTVADEIAESERLLAESVAGLAEKYPDVQIERESIPVSPVRALTDASQNAALLAVGSRGRGAFKGLLLGSVSQGLLHHAECPVAIVRGSLNELSGHA